MLHKTTTAAVVQRLSRSYKDRNEKETLFFDFCVSYIPHQCTSGNC